MPRVLFLVNLREHGSYICHARVTFASARELQEFLTRNTAQEKDGWSVLITRGPARGYDGKPLHHADIRLSTPFPLSEPPPSPSSEEKPDVRVSESKPEQAYAAPIPEDTEEIKGPAVSLTWEPRVALQKASKTLHLQELGVSDLGLWR